MEFISTMYILNTLEEDIINVPVYNGTYDPTKLAILYSIIRDKRPYTFQSWTMHIAV